MVSFQDRRILHCDCNAFFASVEETFNPDLKNSPMAVAGDPDSRHGIILAKNELAKKFGIQTAETVWSARKKCPQLVLVPARHGAYGEFSERVNAVYAAYTPLVERFGTDESFLDVTGRLRDFGGDAARCAHDVRQRIKREIGITVSVGVSWNRIFAKLGSDYKKPDAVTVISPQNWKSIVFPLPAGDLFMVGQKTAAALLSMGVRTIGDLAAMPEDLLVSKFGKAGTMLHRYSNGLDESPVTPSSAREPAKSVGNGFTFRRDLVSEGDVRTGAAYLSDKVASRLRAMGMKCASVHVTVKDPGLKSVSRQMTVEATCLASDILAAALALISRHWEPGRPIRALTVTGSSLTPTGASPPRQLSFLEDGKADAKAREERLESALDGIRARFGGKAAQAGSVLENDIGIGGAGGGH